MDDICQFRGTLRVTSTNNAHTTLPRTDDSSFWGRARERMSIKIIRDNGAKIKYWPHRVTYYIFKCFYMALVCNVNVYVKLIFSTQCNFRGGINYVFVVMEPLLCILMDLIDPNICSRAVKLRTRYASCHTKTFFENI